MPYIGKTPTQGVRERYYYTTSGSETSLSGADDNGLVLNYADAKYVDVYLNGLLLVHGTDYNTNTTDTIAGLTALAANDIVGVLVYDVFSIFGGDVTGSISVQKDNLKIAGVAVTTTAAELNKLDGTPAGLTSTELGYVDGVTSSIQTQLDAKATTTVVNTKAPIDAPTFTGTPAVPTASASTNTTQAASTAYVTTAIANLADSAPATLNTLNELAAALGDDANFSTTVTNSIATKAPIDAPTFTGTVTANGGVVFNETSADVDFRVESNGNTNMINVDGGNNRVGIGMVPYYQMPLNVNGQVGTSNGTAGAPTHTFYSDADTGMYRAGANILGLSTAGTERMRITAAGNVGIGNSDPEAFGSLIDNLVIGTTSGENGMTIVSGTSNGGRICFADNTASPQRGMFEYSHASDSLKINTNGATRTTIDSSGNLTQTANITAFSDRRLKSDIQTVENALEKVEQLRGVTYTRNDIKENGQQLGVIAQEVEEVFPQVVLTADDERGTKSVDYGRLTGALIEAIKELSAKVKELEGELK